jgi:FAD/FMN-containing dehydrogenase
MHDGAPALVASCSGTADVVDAVNFARDQALPVAVRGGGRRRPPRLQGASWNGG